MQCEGMMISFALLIKEWRGLEYGHTHAKTQTRCGPRQDTGLLTHRHSVKWTLIHIIYIHWLLKLLVCCLI